MVLAIIFALVKPAQSSMYLYLLKHSTALTIKYGNNHVGMLVRCRRVGASVRWCVGALVRWRVGALGYSRNLKSVGGVSYSRR